MRAGKRVIALFGNQMLANAATRDVTRFIETGERVAVSLGRERITHPSGGEILLRSWGCQSYAFDGLRVEVAFFDGHWSEVNQSVLEVLHRSSQRQPDGELLFAN